MFNQCFQQRDICAGEAIEEAGILVRTQWSKRRTLYDEVLCSPNYIVKVGLGVDFWVIEAFRAPPTSNGEQGAIRFSRDRRGVMELDCGDLPGPSFFKMASFYSDTWHTAQR